MIFHTRGQAGENSYRSRRRSRRDGDVRQRAVDVAGFSDRLAATAAGVSPEQHLLAGAVLATGTAASAVVRGGQERATAGSIAVPRSWPQRRKNVWRRRGGRQEPGRSSSPWIHSDHQEGHEDKAGGHSTGGLAAMTLPLQARHGGSHGRLPCGCFGAKERMRRDQDKASSPLGLVAGLRLHLASSGRVRCLEDACHGERRKG